MRILYVVLSPTFGMYQVAADLGNRFSDHHEVHLLASNRVPEDRFSPAVTIHRVTKANSSGMELASLDAVTLAGVLDEAIETEPDVVHFIAPHIWNLPLMLRLRSRRVPVVYTLHDLDPHQGTRFSSLMRLYNQRVVRLADGLLVYGNTYRERLIADGINPGRIRVIPLLHLFLGYEREQRLQAQLVQDGFLEYQPQALFFGRLEPYKGIEILLEACRLWNPAFGRLIIAGRGDIRRYSGDGKLPAAVELRSRHIADDEAIELFRTSSLLVLPYLDATQSALIAAAYVFQKPVLATRAGALPEYVVQGQTGFLIDPGDPHQLAQALDAAFQDPDHLRRMGRAGYEWYIRKREQEYEKVLGMYESMVSGE